MAVIDAPKLLPKCAGACDANKASLALEVLRHTLRSGLHSLGTLLPHRRANHRISILHALLVELQRVEDSQNFLHVASERKVVLHLRSHDALLVDDVDGPQRQAVVQEAAVGSAHLLLNICQQRVSDGSDSTLVLRRVLPRLVHMLRVAGHAQHLDISIVELLLEVREGHQLAGTDESEVCRVGVQHHILLSSVTGELHLLEGVIRHARHKLEVGRRLLDQSGQGSLLALCLCHDTWVIRSLHVTGWIFLADA
mmetsp:Transcript_39389/g.92278  ORF Transcript_39389/g.92278 Transcript_39389/m.92278 type:complete len:253 (+) Transcript_39389:78-836(+)